MSAGRLTVGVGLLVGLLGAGPARAGEDEPSTSTHAIVLAEDATEEGAARRLEAYSKRAPEELGVSEGFPRVLAGGELPGLPASKHYVVLGFCEDREEAQAALRRVRRAAPKARAASTRAEVEESCPGKISSGASWELQQRAWVTPEGKGSKRAWFIYRHPRPPAACPSAARWRILVRDGPRVLVEQVLGTLCSTPQYEDDEGESSQWRVDTLELDNTTVLHVSGDRSSGGNVEHTHALWAFGCGELVRKSLGTTHDGQGAETIDVERFAPGDGGPPVVRVTRGTSLAPDEPSYEHFGWSEEKCSFVRLPTKAAAE
ncbi:hypothetical protein P2318_01220 [Myxococcaceae bacterium GXIMD 01537]